jgi:hypothetical protein
MANHKIEQLILELENYLECWKQFNHYLNLARTKQFTQEDEDQFLEVKSVLTQGLEVLLAAFETGSPSREEIHSLLGNAPSIRFVSELSEGSVRGIENQWHKIFIAWQSILGQLKVQRRQTHTVSLWGRLRGEEK